MPNPSLNSPVRDLNLPAGVPQATPSNGSAPELTGDLLEHLLRANDLEQAGKTLEARSLYEKILQADPDGFYGQSAEKALTNLAELEGGGTAGLHPEVATVAPAARMPAVESKPSKTLPLQIARQLPVPKRLRRFWGNLSFGRKLIIMVVSAAVIPVATATGVLVWLTQQNVQRDFEVKLRESLASLESEYVERAKLESRGEAENLARLMEMSQLMPVPTTESNERRLYRLQLVLEGTSAGDDVNPHLTKSVRILVDAKGVTVTQAANVQKDLTDRNNFSLVEQNREVTSRDFNLFRTTPGVDLSNLAIVKQVLETGQPLTGVELVPWEVLNRLGLGTQASVWQRTRSESAPVDGSGYQPALVSMAVYPIREGQKVVGASVVGVLLNRNHALIELYQRLNNVAATSIFSEGVRVNTSVPYVDRQTRAIGTLADPDVIEQVLRRGNEYVKTESVLGTNYRTIYRPIYDHQQLVLGDQAKPIGMISVGRPQTDLERLLVQQTALGVAMGVAALALVGLVAIPLANAFAFSLRNLARFAQVVGSGEKGTRLETTERQDEVGILSRELNEMASSIEANIEQIQRQEEQRRQEAEQQRQEKERLQRGVIDLLLQIEGAQRGDLTVRAPMTEGEVGSIADAFNATITNLRQIVNQVQAVTNQVNRLAQTSEGSVKELSDAAVIQSQELTQALKAVVEIDDSVKRVAQSTQEAAAIARQAAEAARLGDSAMDQTVSTIDKIRTAVANTAKQGKRLAESAQEISQILAIISGISDKANLLAFNAAIEAARAGEQGQGFRQVADEVRALAQQVTESAQDIEQLISNIQEETAEVLKGMEVGTTEVVTGTHLVGQTKQILQQLSTLSQKIDQYMQDVATNTVEQTQASNDMSQTMEVVAGIARKTADETQEVVTSLQSLVIEVKTLQVSVSQFRLE